MHRPRERTHWILQVPISIHPRLNVHGLCPMIWPYSAIYSDHSNHLYSYSRSALAYHPAPQQRARLYHEAIHSPAPHVIGSQGLVTDPPNRFPSVQISRQCVGSRLSVCMLSSCASIIEVMLTSEPFCSFLFGPKSFRFHSWHNTCGDCWECWYTVYSQQPMYGNSSRAFT